MKEALVVGIVAPSGYVMDPAALTRVDAYFAGLGHRVIVDEAATLRWQRFAGTDAERIDSLHRMFRRDDVDIVIAARGGYGLSRLLEAVDYRLLAESGKPFIGHSDCSALQLALWAQTQAPSLAGPTACYDFGSETVSGFTERSFWAALSQPSYTIALAARDTGDRDNGGEQPRCSARGMLWGGNLRTLTHLLGSPWFPRIDGGILFVEDVSEHPYRIERMLLQLHHAGVLDRQAAILLGDFSGYKLQDNDGGYDFAAAIDFIRTRTRTPILSGLQFGHVRDKLTLPIGGEGILTSNDGQCALEIVRPAGRWQRLQ
ncbi:MAG: LD-carboxypeptidase [Betaproteobacteria bacterium]